MRRVATTLGALTLASAMGTLGGCALNPTYTVRVDNETNRTLRVSLERRPTINDVTVADSGRVKPDSWVVLGPIEAQVLERVYVVVGDRTDLHAMPESVELSRGSWIVTIDAASITSWGTYELDVRKADKKLIVPEDGTPQDQSEPRDGEP